jgi:hypothetical protein
MSTDESGTQPAPDPQPDPAQTAGTDPVGASPTGSPPTTDPTGLDPGIPSTGQELRDPNVPAAPTTPQAPDQPSTPPVGPSENVSSNEPPPEQQTPTPDGGNVFVPSAAGDQSPPTAASSGDDATPAIGGAANVAGTPQSGLSQAPPMVDESGSNVPAPNMTQPVNTMPASPNLTADSLDPAIVDPEGTARQRVEGRTSDAANREAGVTASEVPPDINAGVKQSDAGPDLYPFPPGGDVDVATVSNDEQQGEYLAPVSLEDTVVFIEHDHGPERRVGRRAFVIDAPRYLVKLDESGDVWITARTRDEINATLTVPLSAVRLERGGRPTTVRG